MKTIHLSDDCSTPIELISLRGITYGNSGAGKTALGRVLFEESDKAGVPNCVIDLKGDWWGLKSSKTGNSDGLQVIIFGGDHADVPMNENAGAEIADIVVELRRNVILDFEAFSKGKQLKFLAAFMDRLYDKNREPLNLICDEADRYIQQRIRAGDNLGPLCNGACEDVAKRGRKHGIFAKFITQRNSDIAKSVTELCDVATIFRTSGPNDQRAVMDWLDAKGDLITQSQKDLVRAKMAGFKNGEGVICSAHPDLRIFEVVKFRWPTTFDSSATPEIGKELIQPKKLAKVDIEALGERIKSTIEEAKKNDPTHLKLEIKRLTTELVREKEKAPEKSEPEKVSVLTEEDRRLLSCWEKAFEKLVVKVSDDNAKLMGVIADAKKFIGEIKAKAPSLGMVKVKPKKFFQQVMRPNPTIKENLTVQTNGYLPEGETKILSACIQYDSGLTRQTLTVLTGYKRSTRDAYIARLREKGYVDTNGETVLSTDAGKAALPDAEPLPTGENLQQYWISKLPEGECKIFRVLLDHYPNSVDRDTISEITGFKRSTRDAYLSRMSAKMITSEPQRGMVAAANQLFE